MQTALEIMKLVKNFDNSHASVKGGTIPSSGEYEELLTQILLVCTSALPLPEDHTVIQNSWDNTHRDSFVSQIQCEEADPSAF